MLHGKRSFHTQRSDFANNASSIAVQSSYCDIRDRLGGRIKRFGGSCWFITGDFLTLSIKWAMSWSA